MTKVLVVVEGGCARSVWSTDPCVRVDVLDLDDVLIGLPLGIDRYDQREELELQIKERTKGMANVW